MIALLLVIALLGMTGAILSTTLQRKQTQVSTVANHEALFVAEAGIAHAVGSLTAGFEGDVIGTDADPVDFGPGHYNVLIERDEDAGTVTLTSSGSARLSEESIEVVMITPTGGIFNNAIFAGNSSGDPNYELKLGGDGVQADTVVGDIFSGQNVLVGGTASVDGTIRAGGSITGASGETGKSQAIPDLQAPDYPNTAEIQVATEFTTGGASYKSNALGGKAWQLPESNPAHIFRKNPNDRAANISATAKDDYFLEDPYEAVKTDSGSTGTDACPITLSGVSGEPGSSSNQKVFFIDGNLWIHNLKTFSFKIDHSDANGVQVTFVARGNIYISDNIFYDDSVRDGLALIAMKDGEEEDSGNIYFGDPNFGTLEEMHAFMYAENNFYDTNLSATGSAVVEVYGNMTAGNQVAINRDYGTQHSKLGVFFDERIALQTLRMPGLPPWIGGGGGGFELVSWRTVASE